MLLGLVVMAGLGAVGAAMRTAADRLPRPRAYWPWLLLLVIWTGDAVLGERRPPFERMEKGVLAALMWTSLAVVIWRRRHHPVKVYSGAGGIASKVIPARYRP